MTVNGHPSPAAPPHVTPARRRGWNNLFPFDFLHLEPGLSRAAAEMAGYLPASPPTVLAGIIHTTGCVWGGKGGGGGGGGGGGSTPLARVYLGIERTEGSKQRIETDVHFGSGDRFLSRAKLTFNPHTQISPSEPGLAGTYSRDRGVSFFHFCVLEIRIY